MHIDDFDFRGEGGQRVRDITGSKPDLPARLSEVSRKLLRSARVRDSAGKREQSPLQSPNVSAIPLSRYFASKMRNDFLRSVYFFLYKRLFGIFFFFNIFQIIFIINFSRDTCFLWNMVISICILCTTRFVYFYDTIRGENNFYFTKNHAGGKFFHI